MLCGAAALLFSIMCGRFDFHGNPADVAEIAAWLGPVYQAPLPPGQKLPIAARYNIAPTQAANVLLPNGVCGMRFGWRHRHVGLLVNARSETASERSTFKLALQSQRCLVPAHGFYEWQGKPGHKQPHYFKLRSDKPMLLAALWRQEPGDGAHMGSFVILTTEPNRIVAPIHNRMPLIFDQADDAAKLWLDPAPREVDGLHALMQPLHEERLTSYPLSRYVSSARNDGPQCLAPADAG